MSKKSLFVLGISLAAVLASCEGSSEYKNVPTAQDQSETASDRTLTQKIRQNVIDDRTLSTAAKNIKIITINGSVTLRGTVPSENEKQILLDLAKKHAGSNVNDEIQVRASY